MQKDSKKHDEISKVYYFFGFNLFFLFIVGGVCFYLIKKIDHNNFRTIQLIKATTYEISNIKERLQEKEKLRDKLVVAMTEMTLINEVLAKNCKNGETLANSDFWRVKRIDAYSKYAGSASLTKLTFGSEVAKKADAFPEISVAINLCENLAQETKQMQLKQKEIEIALEESIRPDLNLLKKEEEKLEKRVRS